MTRSSSIRSLVATVFGLVGNSRFSPWSGQVSSSSSCTRVNEPRENPRKRLDVKVER